MDSNRVQVSAKFKSPKSSTLMKIRSKTSVGNSKNGATGSLISLLLDAELVDDDDNAIAVDGGRLFS